MHNVIDFDILARLLFTIYQNLYMERKHLGKFENLGKNDKYLNVYRYLDVSKLLVIQLENTDKKICNVSIV